MFGSSEPIYARIATLAIAGAGLAMAPPAPSASAQPAVAEVHDDARARELYEIGDEFYANGRYEAAEEAFAEAYRLSGRPLMLFNLANAQERSGRWERALVNLRAYREHAPATEHESLDARIQALERRQRDRSREEREEPVVVIQHDEVDLPAPTLASVPERDPVPPHRYILPAGGALVLTSLGLGLKARSVRDDLRSQCPRVSGVRRCPVEAGSLLDRDRRLSISADILGGVGLATLGVGVYALIRWRRGQTDGPTLDVTWRRDGATLRWRGTF